LKKKLNIIKLKTLEIKIDFPEDEGYSETFYQLDSALAALKNKYPEVNARIIAYELPKEKEGNRI
tara:strand:- start:11192 stop:11386 length:195 start_codon:yes stop_codon:yes gene_type:complete